MTTDYAALLKRSLVAIDQLEGKLAAIERARSEPIAIVGIGCRLPGGADTPEEFWRLLHGGVDAVIEVPKERWDIDRYFDPNPDAVGKTYTRWGAFVDDVDKFDAEFFGISPREAVSMDPQQRLLMEVTWEALEHAGIAPSALAGSATAVYVGISTQDYGLELAEAIGTRNGDAYTASGTSHSIAAGRLSYFLGLHGPNAAIDTACSSSLVAMHWAVQSLRLGEASLALAGGVNLTLTVDGSAATSRARMMSFDGHCKTFDASADGYVRGEGCGMVVLKRLSDAQRDGDRILALIRGSAINQDGRSSGLTAPNGRAQEALIRAALANSHVSPTDIDYVEAHGTGTPLGDPIEVKALNEIYGQRDHSDPLYIASVKTNIGHLEAAAGVAGVIKTVLAMQQRCIPPHLHLRNPNPLISWDQYPIAVPTRPTDWVARQAKPRRAAVSSFGFSGTNAHLVLEEAPSAVAPSAVEGTQLLVLSATTPAALDELAGRYAMLLGSPDAPTWADLTATAALGRSHHPERLAIVATNAQDAQTKLVAAVAGEPLAGVARGRVSGPAPEIVFMFTGQGAQYPGMAQRLFERHPEFRQALEACDRVLAPLLPKPLLTVMFGDGDDAALLNDTAYTQPALFAVEFALAQLWRSWGVEPTAVMGHSVGEYVAACLAGVFSLEDGLRLIAERGRLMSTLPRDGGMAAVFADEARVRAALAGREREVSIAAVNGPQSTVISGRTPVIDALLQQFVAEGIDAQRLNVSHAFHSPLMEPILDRFEAVAASVKLSPPRIGVVSNLTGRLAGDEMCSPAYWRTHLREAVRFADSIATMQREGYRVFVEVGPTPTLLGMARRCEGASGSSWIGSLRKDRDDAEAMLESLGQLHVLGQQIRWTAVLGEDAKRRRATLPSYPFQRESYWHALELRDSRASLAATRRGHPLLGGVLTSPLHIFQSEIGVRLQPWLADHRIFDFTLFPGTGFLELAMAAAREVLDSDASLSDLVIREALRLPDDEPVTVQVIATPTGDDRLQIQVFSRAAGAADAGGWRLHASATASREANSVPQVRDIAGLKRSATSEMAVESYYERLAAQGGHYGPSFRGITSIARGENGVLGRVALEGKAAADASALQVHPALLDACFQLVGAGLPWAQSSTPAGDAFYVPVGMADYRVLRPGVSTAWCYVSPEPAASDAQAFRADVTLLDEAGTVVAELRKLELRRTTRSVLRRALEGNALADWAYEVDWPMSPLPTSGASAVSGCWLVFADATGVGSRLARQLETRGDTVVEVNAGPAFRLDAATGQVDPRDPEQFRRLLSEISQRDSRALKGVVFLWPLDETTPDADFASVLGSHDRLIRSGLHLAQALADVNTRLWFVTRGAQPVAGSLADLAQAPAWGLAGVVASELPSLRCTRIDLDPTVGDDDARVLCDSVVQADEEDRVAWRGGQRHVPRLVPGSVTPAGDTPLRLEITERGSLGNLILQTVARERPGPGEVEIRVHASGLNFRDVLNALGMYPGDAGPLGNECSGVITAIGDGVHDLQVGDDVIAMADRAFATWMIAPAALTVRKPARLTHAEAATIPVTFLTAQLALQDLARIKKGDRVLIHAITGGVGMAALQLALRAGAEVFGTAGSPAKRALALSRGAHHVADSRSLSFAADVMKATGGEGVDIVLNSLAGDFIPESLRLLRPGGRFVEIGKTGIWDAARVSQEFPGVEYYPLYLGEVSAARPLYLRDMLRDLLVELDAGTLSPLPHRAYPIERAEDAFRYMGQGQHTGKIVLTQHPAPKPRSDASYLVTGGLGGLGLVCARWLADAGAGHLVLLGRRAPTPEAESAIAELRAKGVEVTVAQADVADAPQLERVIAGINPPLRGVLHAAGVVDDAMIPQLSVPRFCAVMAPKVRGTWNLHTLTANSPLDFFVMFSSVAALLGSPGQASYAAANAFMDALAQRRRARGAHALSINWGSWAGAGMAAAVDETHRRRWASTGLAMIEPEDGVRMLQDLLYANRTAQAAAVPLVRAKLPANLGPFFAELTALRATAPHASDTGASGISAADTLASLASAPEGERAGLISAFLAEQLVKVLALGASYQVDRHRSVMDMGMDSLMAMELRNRIQSAFKVRLDVSDLLKGPSVHQLSTALLAELTVAGNQPAAAGVAAAETWEEGSL
jgi:acyl transferase domain-containing protein/NADPH:quinone reductase-like Zn-dependent oxidoreductase/NAD(P)-dependent dehydrogenase (short-subunit alcohol dehydrogenase family)/acyl carrier protein